MDYNLHLYSPLSINSFLCEYYGELTVAPNHQPFKLAGLRNQDWPCLCAFIHACTTAPYCNMQRWEMSTCVRVLHFWSPHGHDERPHRFIDGGLHFPLSSLHCCRICPGKRPQQPEATKPAAVLVAQLAAPFPAIQPRSRQEQEEQQKEVNATIKTRASERNEARRQKDSARPP